MFKSLIVIFIILVASSAFAECIGPQIMGKCYGTETSTTSNSNGYQSKYGNNYQYDMSNPVDRNSYSIDPSAQLRDQLDVSPSRNLDRSIGQFGGGIYGD